MGRNNTFTEDDFNFCNQFANVLCKKRKELKLSQQKLANKLGISRQVVQTWESGKTRISLKNTFKLVDAGIVTFENLNYAIKRNL